MPNRSAEHTKLIKDSLEALALAGFKAWKSSVGGYKTPEGQFIRYGKVGGGDITIVLQPFGRHVEAEGKTGNGEQNKNQIKHQKFLVEPCGGGYLVFHEPQELVRAMWGMLASEGARVRSVLKAHNI